MTEKFAYLSCLLLIIFLPCSSLVVAESWTPAKLLNLPSETSVKTARLCDSKDRGFHAVYLVDADPWRVKYRRYHDGELSPPHVLASNFAANPDICEAGNGDVHVVWEDWDGTLDVGWASSNDGGAKFRWNEEITSWHDYAKFPQIAPMGDQTGPDVLMSVWNAGNKGLYYTGYDGSSWGTVASIGTEADNEYCVEGIYRSPHDGSVYRSYGREIDGVISVCYRRFDGSQWQPEVVVARTGFFARQSIAVNPAGQVMIIWEKDETVCSRLHTPGSGWGDATEVAQPAGFARVTALPRSNDFYLVYTDNMERIHGTRFSQGQWGGTELVSIGLPDAFTVGADVDASPDGTLYACWEYWRTDKPQQWFSIKPAPAAPGTIENLSNSADQDSLWPNLAFDANRKAHVTYADGPDGGRRIYYSTNSLGHWTSKADLSGSVCSDARGSAIVFLRDGSPAVFFQKADGTKEVFMTNNIGGQWTTPTMVTPRDTVDSWLAPRGVCVDASGTIHLVFNQYVPSADDWMFHYISKPVKGSWSKPLIPFHSGSDAYQNGACLVATGKGEGVRIHMALYCESAGAGLAGSRVWYLRKGPSGWTSATQLTEGAASMNPSLALAPDGTLHLAFQEPRHNDDWEIWYMKSSDGGQTWSPDTNVSQMPHISRSPECVVDAQNRLYVFWEQQRASGDWEIYRRVLNAGDWQKAECISNSPGRAFEPAAAIHDGLLGVVWVDSGIENSGAFDVAYTHYNIFMGFIEAAADGVRLICTSSPGQSYTVWSCPDLLNATWLEEATFFSQGEFTSWTDPTPAGPQKFYRLGTD